MSPSPRNANESYGGGLGNALTQNFLSSLVTSHFTMWPSLRATISVKKWKEKKRTEKKTNNWTQVASNFFQLILLISQGYTVSREFAYEILAHERD